MNAVVSKLGQAGLMAMLGYEIGHNIGENAVESVERVETKIVKQMEHSDNKELFYIVIILLVAMIIIASLRVMFKKKRNGERIALQQL